VAIGPGGPSAFPFCPRRNTYRLGRPLSGFGAARNGMAGKVNRAQSFPVRTSFFVPCRNSQSWRGCPSDSRPDGWLKRGDLHFPPTRTKILSARPVAQRHAVGRDRSTRPRLRTWPHQKVHMPISRSGPVRRGQPPPQHSDNENVPGIRDGARPARRESLPRLARRHAGHRKH
jgi:hypothetical protein